MPEMIVLTPEERLEVRGLTSAYTALRPLPNATSTEYFLPPEVTENHSHAEWRDYLNALPRRNVAIEEFKWYADQQDDGPMSNSAKAVSK